MLVVQVLVRQQDLRVVVDDFAGAANRYGAIRGIAIDRIFVGVANDLLLDMAPAQNGSIETASSQALAPQDDTAHRLWRFAQHEGLTLLLLDEPIEDLGTLVVAADLRWRRACAKLLIPIGCTHQDHLFRH